MSTSPNRGNRYQLPQELVGLLCGTSYAEGNPVTPNFRCPVGGQMGPATLTWALPEDDGRLRQANNMPILGPLVPLP